MIVIGLTGSLGMGKSATALMFAEAGAPVHDADAAVHRLYEGDAVAPIEDAFPGVTCAGKVDREKLAARVLNDAVALKRLEAIVHPQVRREEEQFLAKAEAEGAHCAVLDIPLLFETGAAPFEEQRRRVLARPGMTEEKFESLFAKQLSDEKKRQRADFVVDTSQGFDSARAQVRAILQELERMPKRCR
jgi:dephospho-CoA kinase